MKKQKILFISMISIFAFTILLFILVLPEQKVNKICFEDNCFFVELAQTKFEWAQGLMNRESLERDSGMLFIFPEEKVFSFWMKDTFIPLDIIWINGEGEVVFVKENALPCGSSRCEVFSPGVEARYVLEINSGLSRKFGIHRGDKIIFHPMR